jgi:hypothetical protein
LSSRNVSSTFLHYILHLRTILYIALQCNTDQQSFVRCSILQRATVQWYSLLMYNCIVLYI